MQTNDEMSEMRSQMALLKQKIEGEKMVNERLVGSIVRQKVGSMRRNNVWQMVSSVIMIPFCGIILTQLTDCSLTFIIATELIFTAALVLQWFAHRGMSAKMIAKGNLTDTAKWLVKLKRFTLQQRRYSLPIVCLWLVWFYFEVMQDKVVPLLYVAISLAAAILGIICAVANERKQLREIAEVLSQIKELGQTD